MNEYTFEEWRKTRFMGNWSEFEFFQLHAIPAKDAVTAIKIANETIRLEDFESNRIINQVRNLQKIG